MDPRTLLPARYNPSNVRRALADPRLLRGELTQLGTELNVAVHRRVRRVRRDDGWQVMDEDWDNLLILDACRYDMYRARRSDSDGLESRVSPGSESWEFMQRTFQGRTLHDAVYVTANPHAYRLDDDVFHHVRNLLDDEWDPELQTVLPSVVADAARDAHERFPDKRLVVHFMQPHFPFIGPTGRDLDSGGIVYHRDEESDDGLTVWGKLRYGLLDRETVWRAFGENLDLALEAVDPLLGDLPGRSVVTADHGNLVGERLFPVPTRGYGHPPGLRAPALVTVPWHVVDSGERRTVTADPPIARRRLDEGLAERRLRALGYRE